MSLFCLVLAVFSQAPNSWRGAAGSKICPEGRPAGPLGLLREGEGVAVQVLAMLGADPDRVRDQVRLLVHGQTVPVMGGEGQRLGDEADARIDSLEDRLVAIERWAGMRSDLDDLDDQIAQVCREKEAAIDQQDFQTAAALRDKEKQLIDRRERREKDLPGAVAGRPSLAQELARLNAELERLRGILRQHGIEPGDDAA